MGGTAGSGTGVELRAATLLKTVTLPAGRPAAPETNALTSSSFAENRSSITSSTDPVPPTSRFRPKRGSCSGRFTCTCASKTPPNEFRVSSMDCATARWYENHCSSRLGTNPPLAPFEPTAPREERTRCESRKESAETEFPRGTAIAQRPSDCDTFVGMMSVPLKRLITRFASLSERSWRICSSHALRKKILKAARTLSALRDSAAPIAPLHRRHDGVLFDDPLS
jgi:hypothetical protein